MSSIERAQNRQYAAFPTTVTLGAAVQTVNIEVETVKATKLIEFGVQTLTTVPANDLLTPAWLVSIQITVNQTEVIVPAMTRADYVNIVQNLEMKEVDLITPCGNMLFKKFDPPLPAKTKIQIQLVVNTLALATFTPAATCVLTPVLNVYDSIKAGEKRLTYYIPLGQIPQVAGVTAGQVITHNLGNYARLEKAIIIITENPVGTLVDTWHGQLDLLADGQTVMRMNEPSQKNHYSLLSDGLPVPVGHHALICPEGGFQAAINNQLSLNLTPYLTVATAIARGYEIFEKPYK